MCFARGGYPLKAKRSYKEKRDKKNIFWLYTLIYQHITYILSPINTINKQAARKIFSGFKN